MLLSSYGEAFVEWVKAGRKSRRREPVFHSLFPGPKRKQEEKIHAKQRFYSLVYRTFRFRKKYPCPIEICRQRDVKGLYKLAEDGKLKNFTGVDDPYEEPEHPELVIETDKEAIEESVERIFAKLIELGYLSAEETPDEESKIATDRLATLGYLT